jgi:hypothetical protein
VSPRLSLCSLTQWPPRAPSYRRLDKHHRRKELYTSIYSEMSEAIDATAERGETFEEGLGEEEDATESAEGTFPHLIARQYSADSVTMTASAPSVTSFNGTRNRYRQLADALCLEAQEVERHSDKMLAGGWGSEPSLVPYTGPDLTVLISPSQSSTPQGPSSQSSYIIVRGDGRAVDPQEGGSVNAVDMTETEPDIDGMFLTQEEQAKKY